MAALPQLMSVEQFRELPKGEFQYELHHGELIALTRRKPWHWKMQMRLRDLLAPRLEAFGRVGIEIPFRLFPEFDLRAADVVAISHARFDAIDPDDDLRGAPELVIEVKSPSNTRQQLRELVSICLNHGAIEVWIVAIERKSVTVVRHDGSTAVFAEGSTLSLAAFGGGELPVDDIFSA